MDDAIRLARDVLAHLGCWKSLYSSARPIDDPDVSVIAAALHDDEAPLREEIEQLQADAANSAGLVSALKSSIAQMCEAIGIERGRDGWHEFMTRLKAHVAGIEARGIEQAAQWVHAIDPTQQFYADLADDLRALATQSAPQDGWNLAADVRRFDASIDQRMAEFDQATQPAPEPRDDR